VDKPVWPEEQKAKPAPKARTGCGQESPKEGNGPKKENHAHPREREDGTPPRHRDFTERAEWTETRDGAQQKPYN